MSGTVVLYSEFNFPIMEYSDGDMFGAADTLLDLPRNTKAITKTNMTMMYLTKKLFETLFVHCQDYCFKMIIDSKLERDRLTEKIKLADEAHFDKEMAAIEVEASPESESEPGPMADEVEQNEDPASIIRRIKTKMSVLSTQQMPKAEEKKVSSTSVLSFLKKQDAQPLPVSPRPRESGTSLAKVSKKESVASIGSPSK